MTSDGASRTITRTDVVGVLLALALLGVMTWFAIPEEDLATITRQDTTALGGAWPFTVDEISILCPDVGPVYEFSTGSRTLRLSDQELAEAPAWVPADLRAGDADWSPASVSWVRSEARQICDL